MRGEMCPGTSFLRSKGLKTDFGEYGRRGAHRFEKLNSRSDIGLPYGQNSPSRCTTGIVGTYTLEFIATPVRRCSFLVALVKQPKCSGGLISSVCRLLIQENSWMTANGT